MRFLILVFLSVFLAGCSAPKQFSYHNPQINPPQIASLLEKVKEIEKQDFKNVRIETIAENELSSHHLVVIREKEPLHYHANHDGWALVLKGEADFLLGKTSRLLRRGDMVYIPRGVPHQATRRGREALAAFVIFTPPFDGKDTIPVENKDKKR